jgi:hypothetical protein
MILDQGEVKVFEEGASYYQNYIAVGGKIIVTNSRILFESNSGTTTKCELALPLSKITDVQFFKSFFISPNGLSLMLNDGSMENFIVDDRKLWKSRILDIISQKA